MSCALSATPIGLSPLLLPRAAEMPFHRHMLIQNNNEQQVLLPSGGMICPSRPSSAARRVSALSESHLRPLLEIRTFVPPVSAIKFIFYQELAD
eukprot:scaffold5983_cov62-Cyclotella_meneghiniana.AAC.3